MKANDKVERQLRLIEAAARAGRLPGVRVGVGVHPGRSTRPVRRYFGPERFAEGNPKLGETFSVDSGMGGSHAVEYAGHFEGRILFKRRRIGGWPAAEYWYSDEEHASEHLYILMPANYHPPRQQEKEPTR